MDPLDDKGDRERRAPKRNDPSNDRDEPIIRPTGPIRPPRPITPPSARPVRIPRAVTPPPRARSPIPLPRSLETLAAPTHRERPATLHQHIDRITNPTLRRLVQLSPGIIATLIAATLGTALWAILLGLLLFVLALTPRRTDAIIALVSAPLIVSLGIPLTTLLTLLLPVWLLIALGLLTPLHWLLGARLPMRGIIPMLGTTAILTTLLLIIFHDTSWAQSDINTGITTILLAAATAIAWAFVPWVGRPRPRGGQ